MAAFDTVIRNAFVVDGTGAPPFTGSVAIRGGRIAHAAPGDVAGKGAVEIDARGRMVAPGWVDIHSHFDAQALWDPFLTPSCAAGVTTLVAGNCGVGFAPCRPNQRDYIVQLMEGVEDIPAAAIKEGLGPGGRAWEFETFPEYLDVLARRRFAADLAVMVSHGAVRTYCLDEARNRTADRPGGCFNTMITAEEVARMAAVVREAVAAGAIGFSCNRFANHRAVDGSLVPGTLSMPSEVVALSRAVAEGGGGVIEVVSDFTIYDDIPFSKMDEGIRAVKNRVEWEWMEHVMRHFKLPISIGSGWGNDLKDADPTKHVGHFVRYAQHAREGMVLKGQVMVRPQGFLQCFNSSLGHFVMSATFQRLKSSLAPDAFRAALLLPANRLAVLSEMKKIYGTSANRGSAEWYIYDNRRWFKWTPGYEPRAEDSIYQIGRASGRHPLDLVYDILAEDGGRGVLWRPNQNYGTFSLDQTFNALMHDGCTPGTSDAGAHNAIMQDSTAPTNLLTHFVRDRTRGPKMPVEFAVRRQTRDTARLFGLADRGTLEVGMRADLNIIDMEKLRILRPTFEHDLPTGAPRWMQLVEGYDLTMVAGVATYSGGRATGELPGRLVRNPGTFARAAARDLDAPFDDTLRALIKARAVELGELRASDIEVSDEAALRRAMENGGGIGLTTISRLARLTEKNARRGAAAAGAKL